MTSSPPIEGTPSQIGVGVRLARDGDDFGGAVCFAVDNGPPEVSTSEPLPGGRLRMRTEITGRVVGVDEHALELEHGVHTVRVRYLLPRAIDLAPLLGAHVTLTVQMVLDPKRAPTVDATIRAMSGRLLLWARDGALPTDRPGRPQVRASCSNRAGRRLAFGTPTGLASIRDGERVDVSVDGGTATILAVRVADDDAAFVLVSR